MPKYRTRWRYKYDLFIGWGFTPLEARSFAKQYTVKQIRTLPYLVALTRWRRLYISNLRKRGYSDQRIKRSLLVLYKKREWVTKGKLDPWKMLKGFRNVAIDKGDYTPPVRKGSHHKGGVTKGDIAGQKRRRRQRKTFLEDYAQARGKE